MSDRRAIFLILVLCASVVALMLPFREQGFTDDFAYAQSVRQFLRTGELKVTDFSMVTLIFPILWGSLFAKIFGFSFVSLQLSTIAFLPILGIGMYFLLKEFGLKAKDNLVTTIGFLSIPWFFQFTFTFMNDVPFVGLEVLSLFFYSIGIRKRSWKLLVLGSISSALAFLTRQIGIVLPVASAATMMLQKELSARRKFMLILSGVLFPAAAAGWYAWWLSLPGNITLSQIWYRPLIVKNFASFVPGTSMGLVDRWEVWKNLLHRVVEYFSQTIGLLSPFVLAVVVSNLKLFWERLRRYWRTAGVVSVAMAGVYAVDISLNTEGYTLGFPLMIYQYEAWFPWRWEAVWRWLVVLSMPIWAIFLAAYSSVRLTKLKGRLVLLFSFVGLGLATVLSHFNWEEYLMPLLPFFFVWLGVTFRKFRLSTWLVTVVVLLLCLDSLQMTKLRYDEEGVAWEKAVGLTEEGSPFFEISPNRNLAWEGWHRYEVYIDDLLRTSGGDKYLAAKRYVWRKIHEPKYFIISERQMNRLKLGIDGVVADQEAMRSLFIDTVVLTYNLEDGIDVYSQ